MVVYLVENLINGKRYIGMDTKNNPKYLGSGTLIKISIRKYGSDNFKKIILEECKNISELEKRESFWINYYNALTNNNFYNLEDNRKRGINPFKNKTKKELDLIYQKRESKRKQTNIKIGRANMKSKPKSFSNKISDIKRGVKRSVESKIKQGNSLRGRTSPNKGNKWNISQKRNMGRVIIQLKLDGTFIKEWSNIKEAKKILKLKGINNNLKLLSKTCGGFIFKYK